MDISATDNASGMKSITLYDSSNKQLATGVSALKYTETKEGVHNYKIVATDIAGNVKEERFVVNIDRTAPTGQVKYDFNDKDIVINIKVDNVIELGSGVKDIWVEYTSKDNSSNIIKESLIAKSDGSFTISTDLFDKLGSANTVNIVVKAVDNVGNVGILGNHEVDIFKVEAIIERVLSPHTPNFMSGEKGILKIKLYGGVDKYRVTFPNELVALDDTLNFENSITPKKITEIEYDFFIPLESPNGNYSVTVDGYKNGEKKVAQPTFTVSGKITDKLRTRVRLPD